MNSESRKTYQKLKNDLERMVPDSELDSREKELLVKDKPDEASTSSELWEDSKRFFKNFLVATLCVIIILLWWFDWNFSALANRTSDVISGLFGDEITEIGATPPTFEVPPVPGPGGTPPMPELSELGPEIEAEVRAEISRAQNEMNMGMSDYVSAMEEAGYRDLYSMPELSVMYQTGVEISYLDELNEVGLLEELPYTAIITFFSADVSTDYIVAMNESGYLERYGFPGVTAFYSSDIPVSYLNDLEEKGMLDDLSFSDILLMYQSE